MRNRRNAYGIATVMASALVLLAGCQEPEGPAEKAGKELDKAAAEIGKSIESVGDTLQKAAD